MSSDELTFQLGSRAEAMIGAARSTAGFMPDAEGLALTRAAGEVIRTRELPAVIVEIGAYCGRSTLYLAAGAAGSSTAGEEPAVAPGAHQEQPIVFSVDHHHGSEENQAGWPHHDPSLVDPRTGRMDTLSRWRSAVEDAQAGDLVVGVVGDSPAVARHWATPIGLLFIDGGHGSEAAWADYHGWAPHVTGGGLLAIHDVFLDPAEGGRPPYELYRRAIESSAFVEVEELGKGSLRVLRRVADGE